MKTIFISNYLEQNEDTAEDEEFDEEDDDDSTYSPDPDGNRVAPEAANEGSDGEDSESDEDEV